jgi:hypothetical protein
MEFAPSLTVVSSIYKGERFLLDFFANLKEQTIFPELQTVLVLNDPTAKEKTLASDFQARHPLQVETIIVRRETLGASWNRGLQAARAPLVALWNVDDRREPDSLQRQLVSIESNPDSVLCYGDYVHVREYGSGDGKRRSTPFYSPRHFSRSFAQGGAFLVFRKELTSKVGPFDEQLRVAADMDFSFRVASLRLRMSRCEGILGYFTDASEGLSTQSGAEQSSIERTLVQLRYGVFDKVHPRLREKTAGYKIDQILHMGTWTSIEVYIPGYRKWIEGKSHLWVLGKLRLTIRALLEKTGILELAYQIQERLLGREI